VPRIGNGVARGQPVLEVQGSDRHATCGTNRHKRALARCSFGKKEKKDGKEPTDLFESNALAILIRTLDDQGRNGKSERIQLRWKRFVTL